MGSRFPGPEITVVGIAAALRFATLGVQSYWSDEAATVGLVHRSFGQMLSRVTEKERTPYVYYAIAWVWNQAFGSHEAALRSLSALCGTLTVVCVYLLVREVSTRRAALTAALLTAVSPILVWYSQEARSYALLAMLSSASLWLWLRSGRTGRSRDFAGWTIVSILALATHYFAAFLIAPCALYLLRSRVRRAVLAIGLAALAAAQCALAALAVHQANAQAAGDYITRTPLLRRVLELPKRFLLGEHGAPGPTNGPLGLALAALMVMTIYLYVTGNARARGESTRPLVVVLATSVLLPLGLALLGVDFFAYRNLLASWLIALAITGLVLGTSSARTVAAAATTVTVAIGIFINLAVDVSPSLQRADWRYAASALGPPPPGTRLIVLGPSYEAGVFRIYVSSTRLRRPKQLRVSEIDLVGYRVPPGYRYPRVTRGFRLLAAVSHQKLSFVRYVSPRPRRIDPLRVRPLLAGSRAFLVAGQ